MRVNFGHRFTDENGRQIKFGVKPYSKFKDLAVQALLHAASGEGEPDAKEKIHRYQLAAKLRRVGETQIEVKPEDCDLILRCCGKAYHTLIVGAMATLLEGKPVQEFPKDEEEGEEKPTKLEKVEGGVTPEIPGN